MIDCKIAAKCRNQWMSAFIDLTGQRYGRWLVLTRSGIASNGKATWLCRCECGTERIVSGDGLRSGHSQSCGCLKLENISTAKFMDLVGKQFGHLLVESRIGNTGSLWLCRCTCGNQRILDGIKLRGGLAVCCKECTKKRWLARRMDLRGQIFGDWLVVDYGNRTTGRRASWLCRCKCGNERLVYQGSLLKGQSGNCGCGYKDHSGETHGFLTVIKRDGHAEYGDITYLCKCACGNETIKRRGYFVANPAASCGCNSSNNGFDQNKPATFYYLKILPPCRPPLYKVGITNRSIKERFGKELDQCVILLDARFEYGSKALRLEQSMLKAFSKHAYSGPALFESGNSELFTKDILNLDAASGNPQTRKEIYANT